MPKPIRLRLEWADGLYEPPLAERISGVLDASPETLAIVNSIWSPDGLERRIYTSGDKVLSRRTGRRRIENSPNYPSGLLPSGSGHGYNKVTHYPNNDRGSHVFLHKRIAIVLHADPARSRKRKELEGYYSYAILQRPTSKHEDLKLLRSLRRITEEARGLLDYVWPHGIELVDDKKHLPAGTMLLPAAA